VRHSSSRASSAVSSEVVPASHLHRLHRIHQHLAADGAELPLGHAHAREQPDVAAVPRLLEGVVVEQGAPPVAHRRCQLRPAGREALLEREILDGIEIDLVLKGEKLPQPNQRPTPHRKPHKSPQSRHKVSRAAQEEKPPTTTSKALMNIEEIEGIGSTYGKKLKDQGIMTTEGLLSSGSTPTGRKQLAEKTGISEKLILEWVNLADLLRINGVGQEYSDLLEEAGVNTVVELAQRNPDNLHEKILKINKTKQLVRKSPSLNQIKDWIDQAKRLPRKVEY